MIKLVNISNPEIVITAPDDMVKEVGGNCWQVGGSQPLTFAKHLWRIDKKDTMEVPVFVLESIENTLRIQNNINLDKKTGETCQDRNVRESLNFLRKLLNGEVITGGERLEKLHTELPTKEPQGLDEAAERWAENYLFDLDSLNESRVKSSFKAGAKWQAENQPIIAGLNYAAPTYLTSTKVEQGITFDYTLKGRNTIEGINMDALKEVGISFGDNVTVQIRKR